MYPIGISPPLVLVLDRSTSFLLAVALNGWQPKLPRMNRRCGLDG